MFLKHCPQGRRRAVRHRMDVLAWMSWHGCPESANKSSRSSRAGIEPARCLDSNTCEACLAAQKRQSRPRPPLHPSPPEHTTCPREHTRPHHGCDGGAGERSIAAAQAVRPRPSTRRPRNLHPRPPPHFPASRGAAMGEITLKLHFPIFPYFAASCAHFASVVRKEFAAAGGSTSPVNAALNVIMCP
jgi:hypothetical protein